MHTLRGGGWFKGLRAHAAAVVEMGSYGQVLLGARVCVCVCVLCCKSKVLCCGGRVMDAHPFGLGRSSNTAEIQFRNL